MPKAPCLGAAVLLVCCSILLLAQFPLSSECKQPVHRELLSLALQGLPFQLLNRKIVAEHAKQGE